MLNLFPNPSPLGLALDPTGNRGYNFRAVLPQSRPLDDKNPPRRLQLLVESGDVRTPPAGLTRRKNGYNTTVGPPASMGPVPG